MSRGIRQRFLSTHHENPKKGFFLTHRVIKIKKQEKKKRSVKYIFLLFKQTLTLKNSIGQKYSLELKMFKYGNKNNTDK